MNTALQVLKDRGFIAQCTDFEGLSRLMDQGPVICYEGTDPTGSSLHIGHMVPFFAMKHLLAHGHKVIALLGGGTARIGDPSGKTEMRQMLSYDQINENIRKVTNQLEKFIPFDGKQCWTANNADWLADLNYIDFLRDVGQHFSVNRMLTFDAYKKRMETGLSFIEFNYQLLQSYDFLQLFERHGCRLQIGGDDQWGNIVAGIDLVRRVKGAEVYGLTFPLVTTSDGKKMGKTEKGALFLDPSLCSPYDFFQYWRNVQDQDVERFLLMFTFLPVHTCKELGQAQDAAINQSKEKLAWEITAIIHGQAEADKALSASRAAFSAGLEGDSTNMPSTELSVEELEQGIGILELIVKSGIAASKAEARRLVQQGGIIFDGNKIESIDFTIDKVYYQEIRSRANESGKEFVGLMLRAGKKRWQRIVLA